jgi:hypothetical protein
MSQALAGMFRGSNIQSSCICSLRMMCPKDMALPAIGLLVPQAAIG